MQKSHLALIDALMSLAAKETVGRVKMAVEAEQMGVGAPWENALLFWVNRVRPRADELIDTLPIMLCCSVSLAFIVVVLCLQLNQMLRESTEEEEPPKSQTCTDLQPAQEMVKTQRLPLILTL